MAKLRTDLEAVKLAIETTMSNDIDDDPFVPEEIVEQLAALHSALSELEKKE